MSYYARNHFYRAPSAATLARRASEKAALLAANPGLEEALKTSHPIVSDIAEKLTRYGSLSPKQVALVLKLAGEATARATARASEAHVPAPTGKVKFTGKVVSTKWKESVRYGSSTAKMTVKVETPSGSWLAWGTVPASLLDAVGNLESLRGATVEVEGTLSTGNDAHFAFFKRPKARLVAAPAAPTSESDEFASVMEELEAA